MYFVSAYRKWNDYITFLNNLCYFLGAQVISNLTAKLIYSLTISPECRNTETCKFFLEILNKINKGAFRT